MNIAFAATNFILGSLNLAAFFTSLGSSHRPSYTNLLVAGFLYVLAAWQTKRAIRYR